MIAMLVLQCKVVAFRRVFVVFECGNCNVVASWLVHVLFLPTRNLTSGSEAKHRLRVDIEHNETGVLTADSLL